MRLVYTYIIMIGLNQYNTFHQTIPQTIHQTIPQTIPQTISYTFDNGRIGGCTAVDIGPNKRTGQIICTMFSK
jgi:hypothetical protein